MFTVMATALLIDFGIFCTSLVTELNTVVLNPLIMALMIRNRFPFSTIHVQVQNHLLNYRVDIAD